MKSETITRTEKKIVRAAVTEDPAWESIKAGLESVKRGKITEWKPRFSK